MLRHIVTAGLTLTLAASLSADWPQWRGPDRDGHTDAFQAPEDWPANLTKGWSIEVGEGHSSPIIVSGMVYQFSREGDEEVLRALRLDDGGLVWRTAYPAPYTMNSAATGHGKGPKATPTFVDGRIYTFGISGILSCFNADDGKLVWRHEFSKRHRETSPLYGAAMSPAVADGRVLAHVGGPDDGSLTAFEAATGKEIWSWREDGPGYSSPLATVIDGVRQVITQTQKFVVGVDFETGKTLWKIPFSTPYDQNSLSPVLLDNLLIYSGTGQPAVAVRISREGGDWTTKQAWSSSRVPMYMSTPVLSGELLFGLTQRNKGALFCLNARTGELLWQGPPRQGDNASLILSGELLLAVTTEAELTVAKTSGAALTIVKTYETAESSVWAHPALSGPFILIKDKSRLTRWSVR